MEAGCAICDRPIDGASLTMTVLPRLERSVCWK